LKLDDEIAAAAPERSWTALMPPANCANVFARALL
jgi:hypothetical protein